MRSALQTLTKDRHPGGVLHNTMTDTAPGVVVTDDSAMRFAAVHALGIEAARMNYCKKADKDFMKRLNVAKPSTRTQLQGIWYNGNDESCIHYSNTRYRMLNFHAVLSKGTVEFRCFNGTTHAGEIRAYIQFCMAVSHQAISQRTRSEIRDHWGTCGEDQRVYGLPPDGCTPSGLLRVVRTQGYAAGDSGSDADRRD